MAEFDDFTGFGTPLDLDAFPDFDLLPAPLSPSSAPGSGEAPESPLQSLYQGTSSEEFMSSLDDTTGTRWTPSPPPSFVEPSAIDGLAFGEDFPNPDDLGLLDDWFDEEELQRFGMELDELEARPLPSIEEPSPPPLPSPPPMQEQGRKKSPEGTFQFTHKTMEDVRHDIEKQKEKKQDRKRKRSPSPPPALIRSRPVEGATATRAKKIRWDWLSFVTPATAESVQKWMLQLSEDLFRQILSAASISPAHVFPDAHIIAEVAASDREARGNLEIFGMVWTYLLELDVLALAMFAGGAVPTFSNPATFIQNHRRFSTYVLAALYGRHGQQMRYLMEPSNAWRVARITLEFRRRLRLNWLKTETRVHRPTERLAAGAFRPMIFASMRKPSQKKGKESKRGLLDDPLILLSVDTLPWPVFVSKNRIGFAVTSSDYVYHYLPYEVYGPRHRAALMALIPFEQGFAFIAICNVGGAPTLCMQTFHPFDLIQLVERNLFQIFASHERVAVRTKRMGLALTMRSKSVQILFQLNLDQWPVEWRYIRLLGDQRLAGSRPLVPTSLTANRRMMVLAHQDGLLFMRLLFDEASLFTGTGTRMQVDEPHFVPWQHFEAVVGSKVAEVLFRPVANESIPDRRLFDEGADLDLVNLVDASFISPLVSAKSNDLPWVDLAQVQMTSPDSMSALLTLWRSSVNGPARFKLVPGQQVPWDHLGQQGVLTGLVLRFYENEDENPDNMRSLSPALKGKVILPAREHVLVNPDTPIMQNTVLGVAMCIDGLTHGQVTELRVLPWQAIRQNALEETHAGNLYFRFPHPFRALSAYSTWFLESDSLVVVQCGLLAPSVEHPVVSSDKYHTTVRYIALGSYTEARRIGNNELTRVFSYDRDFVEMMPTLDNLYLNFAYCKGMLCSVARSRHALRRSRFHRMLTLLWLDGLPHAVAKPSGAVQEQGEGRPETHRRLLLSSDRVQNARNSGYRDY